ncbi:D-psicose 3-epimerase [bacterium HR39]|nr:D-psicose 3-epimerase [bacterium HR39]
MRLCLCNEVLRPFDFARQCTFAAELGYDALEVAPFTLATEPHRLPPGEVAALRRSAQGAGIAVSGLHWLLLTPPGLSLTTPDPQVRAKTREVLSGLVQLCADLGGRYLVLGSPAQRRLEPRREAEGRARAMELLAETAAGAEEAGVIVCLEPLAPVETDFVNTVAEAAEIVHAIGSPALRTMVDCRAAALAEAEPVPELLRRWLPTGLVAHVHLNDRSGLAPGQGEDRFGPVLAVLRELDYAGDLGIEPFTYRPDGPGAAAFAAGYLRGLSEMLS